MNTMNKLSIEQVSSVYSGVNGSCCCGCAGKHTYSSAHREWASQQRGYAVTSDEVSDRSVKMIVKKINAGWGEAEPESDYVALVVGKRLYVAYLKV